MMLVPEMTRHGYPASFALAVTAASALIAPLIPPGIFLSMALIGLVDDFGTRAGWDVPAPRAERLSKPTGPAFLRALTAIPMPLHMIAGIRGGVFSPPKRAD